MPVRDKHSLIFDAFAQVGRDAELIVHWPGIDLTPPQTELLDALVTAIGYLGRAESWVSAVRIDDWSGDCNCYPSEDAIDTETGEVRGDLIPLWLPQAPDRYAAVRASQLDAALARAKADLHARRADAIAQGKKSLPDPDKAKVPLEIGVTLPEDWLDAVSLDTGELQAAGWSAPPAARQMYYLRPKDALRFMAASPPAGPGTPPGRSGHHCTLRTLCQASTPNHRRRSGRGVAAHRPDGPGQAIVRGRHPKQPVRT
jgi:CRISPR-associated protein Csb2